MLGSEPDISLALFNTCVKEDIDTKDVKKKNNSFFIRFKRLSYVKYIKAIIRIMAYNFFLRSLLKLKTNEIPCFEIKLICD
jgi:hypothetical protein